MAPPWKKGTAAQRAASSLISTAGDLATTTDTGDLVVGDGTSLWAALKRLVRVDEVTTAVQQYVTSVVVTSTTLANLAAESGYVWALVDANGKIALGVTPAGQVIGKISLSPGVLNVAAFDTASLTQLVGAGAGPQVQPLTVEQSSQWIYAIADTVGRTAFAISPDGTVTIPKLSIAAGAIGYSQLSSAVLSAVQQTMPAESGALWALTDSVGRTPVWVTADGTLNAPKTSFPAYSLRDADGTGYMAHPFKDSTGRYQVEVTRKSDAAKTIKTTSTTVDTVEPAISSDGSKLLFRDNSTGTMAGYWRATDGSGSSWPIVPDPTIYCPGDSLTQGAGATNAANYYPAVLGTTLGVATVNDGIGGQSGAQIAARANGIPATLSASANIPTSGGVTCTFNLSVLNAAANVSRTGTLGGIPGTLSWDQPSGVYTFTRTASGSAVTLPTGTPFLTDQGIAGQRQTLSIYSGRNNYRLDAPSVLVAQVQSILNYHKTYLNRFVVLEIVPFTGGDEAGGVGSTVARGTYRDQLDAANAAYAAAFPNNWAPIATYLRSNQAATDAAISYTSQDLTDISNGLTPTSFRSDSGHLNDVSYPLVGRYIAAFMRSKGWYA